MSIAFVFGLANAAHCAGMCGAFALQAAGGPGRITAYLGGKTFSYAFLGALGGGLGLGISTTLVHPLGWLVGALLVISGLRIGFGRRGLVGSGGLASRWLSPLLAGILQGTRGQDKPVQPFALGAVTALLPCGVVYLAALQAVATGNALDGAAVMVAFGLGTVPVLLAVAMAGRRVIPRLSAAQARWVGASVVVFAGLITLARVAFGSHTECLACSS